MLKEGQGGVVNVSWVSGGGKSVVFMALFSAISVDMALINPSSAALGPALERTQGTSQIHFFAY